MLSRLTQWLETRWVIPAYSGWLMAGLAIFFFAAATNTMAGWLYVISGVMLALLAIAALLPIRSLKDICVRRSPISPVSTGDRLTLEVWLENRSSQSKTLILVQDMLPIGLSQPTKTAIERIAAGEPYQWSYEILTERRGIYRWQTLQLRTATPLGLFWCRRDRSIPARAIVYPTVLPLSQCPLIDSMGLDPNTQRLSDRQTHAATTGLTRTLRPYRWGDSIRMVHWRTSARYGELRVRELETYTGGEAIVIALDSGAVWQPEDFEQAVIAAASLYFYARQHQIQVSLWTAATGQIQGETIVLEALAATQPEELPTLQRADLPLVWLTPNAQSVSTLPLGSRWLLWQGDRVNLAFGDNTELLGLTVQPEALQSQLQASLSLS
ncbi:MAG: DUF58 domain-containing protein [Drouetiella hepatica Uher 2000/2452]|jgi:uncharacterized protein (DUF58 family)|uniref:DUF58 domain-containing protein n=1 Tax=Drouetiella hepatica Uher 2000/2452 TaxID=904376 RepID=A0A951UNX1_9CYAN|nr:DUF58 domain-containing protein [Drouetiella hepatica Uher 2000/2452]